jgi:hypothetical protein
MDWALILLHRLSEDTAAAWIFLLLKIAAV